MTTIAREGAQRQAQRLRYSHTRVCHYQAVTARWVLPPIHVSVAQLEATFQAAFLYFYVIPSLMRAQEVQQ